MLSQFHILTNLQDSQTIEWLGNSLLSFTSLQTYKTLKLSGGR